MRIVRSTHLAAVTVALSGALLALPEARQTGNTFTVPLTDPSRPATINVSSTSGDVVVRATDRRDVVVVPRDESNTTTMTTATTNGLRRLTLAAGLAVTEDNNVISVNVASRRGDDTDIQIEVPLKSNLKVAAADGNVEVAGVDGELEIDNRHGDVRLTNVSGSVVANSRNGDVRVVLTRVTGAKPMSFASFNGDVDVTLPASTKATVRLRSDNGDIFTSFDDQFRPAAGSQTTASPNGRAVESGSLSGLINGGGPEFDLRTFNGDVFLRKGAN